MRTSTTTNDYMQKYVIKFIEEIRYSVPVKANSPEEAIAAAREEVSFGGARCDGYSLVTSEVKEEQK